MKITRKELRELIAETADNHYTQLSVKKILKKGLLSKVEMMRSLISNEDFTVNYEKQREVINHNDEFMKLLKELIEMNLTK